MKKIFLICWIIILGLIARHSTKKNDSEYQRDSFWGKNSETEPYKEGSVYSEKLEEDSYFQPVLGEHYITTGMTIYTINPGY